MKTTFLAFVRRIRLMEGRPLAIPVAASLLMASGCENGDYSGNVAGKKHQAVQSRPAEFYVPRQASSVHFHPADPSFEFPFARGASMGYSLPAGTSFPDWLAGLKRHLRSLGYYRLTRNYHPTPEPIGDAAGWHEGAGLLMWKEAWANPGAYSAIFIWVATDEPPSSDGVLKQGTTVSIRQDSGEFMKDRLAEYARRLDVPWAATQSAPDDGAGVQTKTATNAE